MSAAGSSALPFDLPIFSPGFARTKPQIISSFHGSFPVWYRLRTIV